MRSFIGTKEKRKVEMLHTFAYMLYLLNKMVSLFDKKDLYFEFNGCKCVKRRIQCNCAIKTDELACPNMNLTDIALASFCF